MKRRIIVLFLIMVLVSGCSIYKTITNVSRLKFKISSVTDFKVAGIPIENKKSIKDFNTVDALKLSSAFFGGKLPAQFTIYIEAKNPNDGKGGYPSTNITLESLPYKLYIDGKETVSGDISKKVTVPGVGESTRIPLRVGIDLLRFFKDKGYNQLINLALALGGRDGTTSRLKLVAQPVIGTPLGKIKYPQQITIVDYKFN
ncbi:hypothetical protein ACFLR4_03740 [Bacteroidota bacterium]